MTKVGMIGVGKLGQACAEVMAEQYDVIGYDVAPRTPENFSMVGSIREVVQDRDIIFIAVQTPHDPKYDGSKPTSHLPNKDFDYSIVKEILTELNEYCTKDQLVVLISTVLPGTTRREFVPLVKNYRFIYNPYLIAMGSVKWDMVNPEMVIIGTEDGSHTGDAKMLIEFYRPLMKNNPRYEVGTWDEAESIKIFYNTIISAKIGIVNMIQDVAVKNGNMNVDVVTNALANSTYRITGPKYMKAGLGDSGACHPRDNIALRYMAERLELGYDLFDVIMFSREKQAELMARTLVNISKERSLPVYIHGKAYKPNVSYIDGSYSILVAHYVEEMGCEVTYIDPLTGDDVNGPVKGVVLMAHNADVTYDYTGLGTKQSLYCELLDGSVVVDPWREFTTTNENIEVIHYGNTRPKA